MKHTKNGLNQLNSLQFTRNYFIGKNWIVWQRIIQGSVLDLSVGQSLSKHILAKVELKVNRINLNQAVKLDSY